MVHKTQLLVHVLQEAQHLGEGRGERGGGGGERGGATLELKLKGKLAEVLHVWWSTLWGG